MNHSNMLLKRIVIFITLTVFTVTSHCTVLAYNGTTDAETTIGPAASDTAEIAYTDEGYEYLEPDDPAVQELIKDVEPLEAPEVMSFLCPTGIRTYWTEVEDADGYKVFRLETGTAKWTEIRDVDADTIRIIDKKLTNGREYTYAVCAYQDIEVTLPEEEPETVPPEEDAIPPADTNATTSSETAPIVPEEEPDEPEIVYVTIDGNRGEAGSVFWLVPSSEVAISKSGTTLTASWDANEQADGYEIEYSDSGFFESASALTLTGAYATSVTLTDLSAASQYYVRVRSFCLHDGVTEYSPWTLSSNAKGTRTAKAVQLKHKPKKKKIAFELRSQAGYKVGQCDTLQGGCTDGTYGYFVLYNRKLNKCRIIKVQMSTLEIVKKSRAMKIYHGNDMAYNPDRNQLIAIYGQPYYKKIAIIDPMTLKIVETKDLHLPERMPGMTDDHWDAYTGITSIAYNTKYQQYVARIQGKGHLLFFDQDFNPVRYIYLLKKGGQTYQSMDTAGDYILVGQSYASGKPYNIFTVYDWNGAFVSTVNVRKGYELESVFHIGSTFYAGHYTSGYEYVTVTKYKTKRVRGKKKRVKVKVTQKQLYRNNYIYKVTNL